MTIFLTRQARADLARLEVTIADRVLDKLEWFSVQADPLVFAEPLAGMRGIYRFRIGHYRVFVRADGAVLAVLRIRKRSEAYR